MLDFLKICQTIRKGVIEIYPKFIVSKSKDLMIRGGDFYAVWNDNTGLWSTDEDVALQLIDQELDQYYRDRKDSFDGPVHVLHLWDADTLMIDKWHKFIQRQMRDNYNTLDETLVFSNMDTKKEYYASKRLNYPLQEGDIPAYTRMITTLYSPEERHKIEWSIGAIVSGESKNLQKFLVFYGSAGTGKSTVLNVIQDLFKGYYTVFDAKALGSKNDNFSLEPFANNPLVAIQHDGDLSHIEDNTRLNSIVSHETMIINAKYKSPYPSRFNSFLFMGTNRPVKITDAKSGILRRLIDVEPTGNRLSAQLYKNTMSQIKFELGGIAYHCLEVFKEDPGYYDDYVPINMMGASNDFYNYILDQYDAFLRDDGTTLKSAWASYKAYCEDAKITYPFNQRQFKEELKNYFNNYQEQIYIDDKKVINYYSGFIKDKFMSSNKPKTERVVGIKFEDQTSIFDELYSKNKAQYANKNDIPAAPWDEVNTKLSDLDTSKVHYVRLPKNHIVIDFDLKDKDGNKSYQKNLDAANKWPPTYAELSKSGQGIHLHYIYDGDVEQLSRLYSDDIEIKVFTGKSALRRKLSKCSNQPIATINTGLPTKGENKVVNFDVIKSEKAIRSLIAKNIRKEIHPSTKSSIDFIYKILEDAYSSELNYDVSDMKAAVISFAAKSTNQADYCLKLVGKMHFKSEFTSDAMKNYTKEDIIFFDVEVFPNLFVIVWKAEDKLPIKMVNPKKEAVEELLHFKLVGFNCRRYDNHILYAAMMGYSNEQLFKLSQSIVDAQKGDGNNHFFGEAYNISYTDIYDYCAKKQSLKKWEIELGIHHQELGLPWNEPVDEKMWELVADYCVNDVVATEALWKATQGDFQARKMLVAMCEASGVPACVNDTTNTLTTKIIFGREKHPRLVYTDLSKTFPGYEFVKGEDGKMHNMYLGEDVGFGGYVYAEPGIYHDVALLDVASLHPTSMIVMNYYGDYTQKFKDIYDARIFIKHKDYASASKLMGGILKPYLTNDDDAKQVAQALKIAINSTYGLTSAKFENPFKDPRNENNIVALRGALFINSLRREVQKQGFQVCHIKTDSIKIPNATPTIIKFCMDYAKKYGYTFEHEATYEKLCLINDAVYIAKDADTHEWTATGTQFAVPYVFKTLFSHEPIVFDDYCETKSVVKGELYLDMNENLPEDEHSYQFVGRAGRFTPIRKGMGGGILYRKQNDKYYAATGTKGYRWLESEMVEVLGKENAIDDTYHKKLVQEAIAAIEEQGNFEEFIKGEN